LIMNVIGRHDERPEAITIFFDFHWRASFQGHLSIVASSLDGAALRIGKRAASFVIRDAFRLKTHRLRRRFTDHAMR
jgi:hypothetical protein